MKDILLEIISILISSIIVSFACWFYTPDSVIKASVFLPILIVLLTILYGILKYSFNLKKQLTSYNVIKLPKLRTIQQGYLIFEPSELFASQMVVSLYYKDTVEQFIGYGKIETVTSDKKMIQVVVTEYIADWNERSVQRNKDKIIIKPSIPQYILDKVGNYE